MEYVYTKAGPCQVIEEKENKLKVLLPGRKRAQWISKSQVQKTPKLVKLYKKAHFDQDCGCTSVAEVTQTTLVVYNVYGSYKKYTKSNIQEGSVETPHHRRRQLKEKGFTRAKGRQKSIKDTTKEIYRFLKKGYRVA